ncbi:MAG: hypothetical protein CVV05_08415 [Gammaproteobacteria bacterium HGW-Gammaproteobacteria-1]|jgi:hypothetical protein|nr:MAG: hypothetical protein CVV05_08415 [Gammaproteobacteria bacterium HGW-Gammaproteobacteria-1]
MIPVIYPVPDALLQDVSEENLLSDILYYKSMLAEAARNNTDSMRHLSPGALRRQLQECEQRLRRMRGKH